ncbi:MAG: DUF3467 domain-containing protein [Candidatus Micrarchaeota archaeon]|nr:DUF3467 domain-containing protein [Candidatus Micrarchaeota archaeon]
MSENERRNVNLNIDHSEAAFYSDSISIIFNPSKFILDFKQSIPRMDQIQGKEQETIAVKHKTVIIDARFAKSFVETLKKAVENYEKKFGKLDVPKKSKKHEKKEVVTSTESYIG